VTEEALEQLASCVPEDEMRLRSVLSERERLGSPRGLELGGERVLVLELLSALKSRLFGSEAQHENRKRMALLPTTIKRELAVSPQALQQVCGMLSHEGTSLARTGPVKAGTISPSSALLKAISAIAHLAEWRIPPLHRTP
jgi:hypothetical protein